MLPSEHTARYETLFLAFREASDACVRLSLLDDKSDVSLARNPDYQRLHRSGMTIARLGGGKALAGAMAALSGHDPDLPRYWAGMDSW